MNAALHSAISRLLGTPPDLGEIKDGWCWLEKAMEMADLICLHKPQLVVELGVFGGRSLLPQSLAMRESNPSGLVVGIDPWRREAAIEGDTGGANEAWWSNLDLQRIHSDFMDHLWRLDLQTHCLVIRSRSDEAAKLFQPTSIGLLHIDSNHSEEVSCREVRTWLPLVQQGGHIFFDDTNWETTQAANRLLEQSCEKVKDIQTCRLFRVPS